MAHARGRAIQAFAKLFAAFHDDVAFARTVTKTGCRSSYPIGVAERVIATYHALSARGGAPEIARSFADIASAAAEPTVTVSKLLDNFDVVLTLAKETDPRSPGGSRLRPSVAQILKVRHGDT